MNFFKKYITTNDLVKIIIPLVIILFTIYFIGYALGKAYYFYFK
jgi:hypothetical protein